MLNKKVPMIRLMYVNLEKKYTLKNKELITSVEETFCSSQPLLVPEGLEFNDVCILLSYALEYTCIDPANLKIVDYVVKELNKLGFKAMEEYPSIWNHRTILENQLGKEEHLICKSIPKCVDIFLLPNKDLLFNKTKLAKRFKDWYIPDVNSIDYVRAKSNILSNNKKIH